MTRRAIGIHEIGPSERFDLDKYCDSYLHLFDAGSDRPSIYHDRLNSVLHEMLDKLQFDPDNDWIVIAYGNNIINLRLIAILSSLYGLVKVLILNKTDKRYVVATVGLDIEVIDA